MNIFSIVWRLRPNDVEIQLLATTRDLLMSLEEETGLDSGWINNGGLFISHSGDLTINLKQTKITQFLCYHLN